MNDILAIEFVLFDIRLTELLDEYYIDYDDSKLISISKHLKIANNIEFYKLSSLSSCSNELIMKLQILLKKNKAFNQYIMDRII